jgi:integrase
MSPSTSPPPPPRDCLRVEGPGRSPGVQYRRSEFHAKAGVERFASRLVQAGVPLNTVRDLLGHSSVAMSLRYAHLAPDQRREAVAKLNEKPLLALTAKSQSGRAFLSD